MNKRLLSLALIFAISLGTISALSSVLVADAREFSDVKRNDWFYDDVMIAVEKGFTQGYKDGSFGPDNKLNRAEMSTILSRAFELEKEVGLDGFSDVKKGDWFYSSMAKSVAEGIYKGDDKNQLKPYDPITREQAFTTVARALGLEAEKLEKEFPDQDELAGWAVEEGSVAALINLGFIKGNEKGELEPKKNITRAEIIKIINDALEYKLEDEDPIEDQDPVDEDLEIESIS